MVALIGRCRNSAVAREPASGTKITVVSNVPPIVSQQPMTIASIRTERHPQPGQRHSTETTRPDNKSSGRGRLNTAPRLSKRTHPHGSGMPLRWRQTSGSGIPNLGVGSRICCGERVKRIARSRSVKRRAGKILQQRRCGMQRHPLPYFFGYFFGSPPAGAAGGEGGASGLFFSAGGSGLPLSPRRLS